MTSDTYRLMAYDRLQPLTEWRGGRITDVDVLTLADAAREATRHAGTEVTIGDFLRAAARGEIVLRAIVHATAKVEGHEGGIVCNQGMPTENTVPKGAIPTLPIAACQQLANTSRASWRTLEGSAVVDGVRCRFDKAWLAENEPDYETVVEDCRVTGDAVHALADAMTDQPSSESPAATTEQTDAPLRMSDVELAILQFENSSDARRNWFAEQIRQDAARGLIDSEPAGMKLRFSRGGSDSSTRMLAEPLEHVRIDRKDFAATLNRHGIEPSAKAAKWIASAPPATDEAPVELADDAEQNALASEDPLPATEETPVERRARMKARAGKLKASGVKAWQKKLADEEKISPSRVKQILSEKRRAAPDPISILAQLNPIPKSR